MFRLLAMCVAFATTSPALAEDKPKPNALTPQEIADGWILLFDGETTFGWAPHAYRDGKKPEIAAKDGRLIVSDSDGAARFTTPFGYFELTGEYRTAGKGTYLMVVFRGLGEGDGYNSGDELVPSDGEGWQKLHLRSVPGEFSVATREGKGTSIRGTALVNVPPAQIRFGLSNKDGGRIELRNLKLRPLESRPLFTGKDLDGWRVNAADPKRMLSKFEVTKGGELAVKNGPGDLATEKEFDNFVLQFECKTLGKALNSGIFFRCIPGQYQNGYEAQIQNAYLNDDRTKPADYGTGAIYRRVAARKVVSNDNEWFTMTVVANGKHIATWVNGYQTVDWTDDRKENDNPRQGYRAAKGPLSIQGHDKTTDLLFRKIRIAELPAGKK
jgi:hypothetical protein